MGKSKTWFLVFCAVCYFGSAFSQSVLESYPVFPEVTEQRKKLIDIAKSQSGVRELTGKNDGKEIWKYQKAVGIPKGSPWCVAFVVWCHLQLDIPIPVSGYSPDMFRSNLVYKQGEIRAKEWVPRGGEIFGKHVQSKGRVGHVGLIEEKWSKHFHSIEGNTSLLGAIGQEITDISDYDGIWVARKIRQAADITIVADYVGHKELKAATKSKYFKLK